MNVCRLPLQWAEKKTFCRSTVVCCYLLNTFWKNRSLSIDCDWLEASKNKLARLKLTISALLLVTSSQRFYIICLIIILTQACICVLFCNSQLFLSSFWMTNILTGPFCLLHLPNYLQDFLQWRYMLSEHTLHDKKCVILLAWAHST